MFPRQYSGKMTLKLQQKLGHKNVQNVYQSCHRHTRDNHAPRSEHPQKCFVAQSQKTQQQPRCRAQQTTQANARPNKLPCASPARINMWLTLRRGYYRAQISRRRVGGLAAFFLPPGLRQNERKGERERERGKKKNSCHRLKREEPKRASLVKRVKDAPVDRWECVIKENVKKSIDKEMNLLAEQTSRDIQIVDMTWQRGPTISRIQARLRVSTLTLAASLSLTVPIDW